MGEWNTVKNKIHWPRQIHRTIIASMLMAAATFLLVLPLLYGTPEHQVKEVQETWHGTQETEAGDLSDSSRGRAQLFDRGDILTESEEQEILSALEQLSDETKWTCFVLTTEDAGGLTAQEYADDFVDTNAYEEDGVCFLIDMDNREIYISTTGEAIRYLTDNRLEEILDEAYGDVSTGDYADGFLAMIRETADWYEQGVYSDQYNVDEQGNRDPYIQKKKALTGTETLMALIVAAIAAAGSVALVCGRYRLKIGGCRYDFRGNSQVRMDIREDHLVHQMLSHRKLQNENSGGGGHSSSIHTSSGGGTHGGGGRRF